MTAAFELNLRGGSQLKNAKSAVPKTNHCIGTAKYTGGVKASHLALLQPLRDARVAQSDPGLCA
jgi:hypothetical protein